MKTQKFIRRDMFTSAGQNNVIITTLYVNFAATLTLFMA